MKLTHYIYISTALAMLTACGEDIEPVYTVGEADNAIVLSAGVADGMPKTQTRGATRAAGDPTYVAFQTGTKMALRVEGTWLGHGDTYNKIYSPSPTTGTIKDVSDSDKDLDPSDSDNNKDTRGVTLSPQLYWDDYGTADPKNIDTDKGGEATAGTGGRQKGLTIYGVAVDGGTDDFNISLNGTDGTNWTNFQWIIDSDQKTNGWKKYDLLTSNNIREPQTSGDGADGTFKFDNRNTTNPGNLLKFTHAMSKVTINLIAGKGFSDHKFATTPTITLKNFKVSGHVNIITKTTTATGSESMVTPKYASGDGASSTPAMYEAIVYPGRTLTDSDDLLVLEADGNKYYVTTEALYNAITVADKTMKQGVNYVLNITVNKTAVHVEATIVDWVYVTGEDAPKINVDKVYGETTNSFNNDFSVLRSAENIDGTYLNADDRAAVNYSNSAFEMNPQLYWPTHSIHYYFRGVYPQIDKKDNSVQKLGPVIADFVDSSSKTYIKVANEAYRSGYYPSDLMIGMPRTRNGELDETCKVEDHKKSDDTYPGGICATEGEIKLNFRYVMSQVKVELYSSESTSKDHVSFGENTEVIITGGYKEGQIQLSDGVADFTDKPKADYSMTRPTASEYTKYHDAIIPQTLLDGLSFKIKVEDENATGSYDYYEISVKDILVQEQQAGTPETWSDLHTIEAWEPGKIYTYKLTITKTGVKIIATITDWINVKGSTTIWM